MTHQLARLLSTMAALAVLACGGAKVGESCDKPGSRDNCEDGAVCTNEDGGAVCRLLCKDTVDCPAAHACKGVSGTNVKSCQPDRAK